MLKLVFILLAGTASLLAVVAHLGRWSPLADLIANFGNALLVAAVAIFVCYLVFGPLRESRLLGGLALTAVALTLLLAGPELLAGRAARHGDDTPADLTVLTFNVWDLTRDRDASVDTILASGADVVTLQEGVGMLRGALPRLETVYPHVATCDTWWGCEIVVLSKRPFTAKGSRVREAKPGNPIWFVWATTSDRRGRPYTIASTHLARSWPGDLRRRQTVALAGQLAEHEPSTLIVTGDFNASGSSFTLRRQDRLLAPLKRWTLGLGTWPAIVPRTRFKSPFPFVALDHVYAGPAWRMVKIRRLPASGSDHFPVLATLSH